MQTPEEIQKRIDEIKADERLSYPTATVFVNAPLALIQYGLTTELYALEKVLGLPYTKIPIIK